MGYSNKEEIHKVGLCSLAFLTHTIYPPTSSLNLEIYIDLVAGILINYLRYRQGDKVAFWWVPP